MGCNGPSAHLPIRPSNLRQLHRRSQTHRQFASHALVTEQIRPVRRHVNDDLLVRNRNGFQKWRSRWSLRVELQNAGLISAKTELLCRAEHAIGLDAANLAALELERSEERRVGKECRSRWSAVH